MSRNPLHRRINRIAENQIAPAARALLIAYTHAWFTLTFRQRIILALQPDDRAANARYTDAQRAAHVFTYARRLRALCPSEAHCEHACTREHTNAGKTLHTLDDLACWLYPDPHLTRLLTRLPSTMQAEWDAFGDDEHARAAWLLDHAGRVDLDPDAVIPLTELDRELAQALSRPAYHEKLIARWWPDHAPTDPLDSWEYDAEGF